MSCVLFCMYTSKKPIKMYIIIVKKLIIIEVWCWVQEVRLYHSLFWRDCIWSIPVIKSLNICIHVCVYVYVICVYIYIYVCILICKCLSCSLTWQSIKKWTRFPRDYINITRAMWFFSYYIHLEISI